VKDKRLPADLFRMTADSGRSAIVILDKKWRIAYANARAAKLLGVPSPDHLLGRSYAALLQKTCIRNEDGTIADPAQLPSALALQGIETNNKVYENIRRGGAHFWLSIDAKPLVDEKGEVQYIVMRYADISSKKWKEDRLKFLVESNSALSLSKDYRSMLAEKAKLLVPSLADWCTVNVVNLDGTNSRIAVIHRDQKKIPLLEEMVRLAEKETATSSLHKVIHEGGSIFCPTITDEYLSARPPRVAALMKELQVSSLMILPIISREKIVGLLSLAYAESGKCYSEEDARFMEEYCHHLGMVVDNARLYEEVNNHDKEKDNFLAALSHELRNPLAPIRSSLEMLQLTHSSPECKGEIALIQRQFEHFTSIVNDLLDVTRFARGKIHLDKKRIDLSTLLRDIAASYAPHIHDRRIAFLPVIPRKTIFVRADAVRLKQAVMNLLDNAQKFTPPSGKISITLSEDDGDAVISVTDTGIGIAKNEIGHIFEHHFQGSNKDLGSDSGLGMGLELVKHIVSIHGGSVSARSEGTGRGFECTIKIPVEAKVAAGT
jgi:PAS domain S-box-containing protein